MRRVPILLLLLLSPVLSATCPHGSFSEVECPGGPMFGFRADSTHFDRDTGILLERWGDQLRTGVFAGGWIRLYPAVRDPADERQLALAGRRVRAITTAMRVVGVGPDRIRVAPVNADGADLVDRDLYVSTLGVARELWERRVPSTLMC